MFEDADLVNAGSADTSPSPCPSGKEIPSSSIEDFVARVVAGNLKRLFDGPEGEPQRQQKLRLTSLCSGTEGIIPTLEVGVCESLE